jgi:hypothetical protein
MLRSTCDGLQSSRVVKLDLQTGLLMPRKFGFEQRWQRLRLEVLLTLRREPWLHNKPEKRT